MVNKRILIEFADPRLKAVDQYMDIYKAVENAKRNLLVRHNIQLNTLPMIEDHNLFLEMHISEEDAESFRPGNHLRGISKYLLNNFDGFYKKYLVGNRLLYYIDEDDM